MRMNINLIAPPSGTVYDSDVTSVDLWAEGRLVVPYLYTMGTGVLTSMGDGTLHIVEE